MIDPRCGRNGTPRPNSRHHEHGDEEYVTGKSTILAQCRVQGVQGAKGHYESIGAFRVTPRVKARIAGLFYLTIFIAAPSGSKDVTLVKMIITLAADIGVAVLFYGLFKPLGSALSWLAAAFRLLFVVVMGANALNFFGYLNLFGAALSAAAFNTGYGISLVPFGVHCVATGYLIVRSGFLPRTVGILFALAGLGYLTFIWPPLGERLFVPYILALAILGEGSLTLWLIAFGVNADRWTLKEAPVR